MTPQEIDRIQNAINHIKSAVDVDPWAMKLAVEALEKELKNSTQEAKNSNVTDNNVGNKYEYHYDHTDCIWYRPEARNRCPTTCAQYRDGWNDAMNYIFRDGKGYRPFRRDRKYEDGSD